MKYEFTVYKSTGKFYTSEYIHSNIPVPSDYFYQWVNSDDFVQWVKAHLPARIENGYLTVTTDGYHRLFPINDLL